MVRRLKIKVEAQEAVNRYLLNLKKEIGTHIRLLKPNTITEAQTHAIETEIWSKERQPARTQVVTRPNLTRANTNGIRTPNHSLPLADRVEMNCYKCGKTGHFAKPISRQTGFLTRPGRQMTPTTSDNAARGKHGCITNDTKRNTGTNRLRGLSRVSAVCGRLRSIRARRRTGSYQLLVHSGAVIKLMKEKILYKQDIRQKLNFFNKEHVFHIIPNDFPLPEDGIIGLKFFSKYDRYAITPNFLVLDKNKLPLQGDGDLMPAKE